MAAGNNGQNLTDLPRLYTVPEVAAYLGLNRNTVYGMVNRNEIGSMHLGRKVRIHEDQLRAYVDKLKEEAQTA